MIFSAFPLGSLATATDDDFVRKYTPDIWPNRTRGQVVQELQEKRVRALESQEVLRGFGVVPKDLGLTLVSIINAAAGEYQVSRNLRSDKGIMCKLCGQVINTDETFTITHIPSRRELKIYSAALHTILTHDYFGSPGRGGISAKAICEFFDLLPLS